MKGSEVGVILEGCELRWGCGSGSLSQWGVTLPYGAAPIPGAAAQAGKDLCPAAVRHWAGAGQSQQLPLSARPSSQLGLPSYKAGTSPIPYLPGGH